MKFPSLCTVPVPPPVTIQDRPSKENISRKKDPEGGGGSLTLSVLMRRFQMVADPRETMTPDRIRVNDNGIVVLDRIDVIVQLLLFVVCPKIPSACLLLCTIGDIWIDQMLLWIAETDTPTKIQRGIQRYS
jgi:hypothetical protein